MMTNSSLKYVQLRIFREELVMEKFRKMLPYLLAMIFAFYILPFLIIDTGSGMFILLIGIPMICYIVSMIYGIKNSFNLLYPLFIMLLFAPSIFIFYNDSATIYIVIYGSISLIGNFIGSLICKRKQLNKSKFL